MKREALARLTKDNVALIVVLEAQQCTAPLASSLAPVKHQARARRRSCAPHSSVRHLCGRVCA
jgi:hypothetical protein